MSNAEFYRQFEERHRGPRELIKSRLAVYLPYLLPIGQSDPRFEALDVGCGRGEWLELMADHGLKAKGVDTDEGMLEASIERGLDVLNADAVKYLTKLGDCALSVISGFHVAEHLPIKALRKLIKESLRVLKPGGLLILETPNPENLVVASHTFYLDPTHVRPLPPLLLAFMVEYAGFARSTILRLQESPQLQGQTRPPGLWDVLGGASPDYAVVAQKKGPEESMVRLDAAFTETHGIKPDELAQRFDQAANQRQEELMNRLNEAMERAGLEARLAASETRLEEREFKYRETQDRLQKAETVATEFDARAQSAEARAADLDARAQSAEARAADLDARAQAAEARAASEAERAILLAQQLEVMTRQANDWHGQILRIQKTISWRLTAPLRMLRRITLAGFCYFLRLLRYLGLTILFILFIPFLPILIICIPFVLRRPGLRNRLGQRIKRYPSLRSGLRLLAYKLGLIPNDPRLEVTLPQKGAHPTVTSELASKTQSKWLGTVEHAELSRMSPRAREIYTDLLHALGRSVADGLVVSELSKSNYQGFISVVSTIPSLQCGQYGGVAVKLTNQSTQPWIGTGDHPVRLTYRWLTTNGKVWILDGHRSALPEGMLKPGQTITTSMLYQAPEKPGQYVLLLSLVQEGVCWFDQKGFQCATLTLDIL